LVQLTIINLKLALVDQIKECERLVACTTHGRNAYKFFCYKAWSDDTTWSA